MRIHKQRLAIVVVALVGTLACFIPLGRVPLVWSLHGIQEARKVVLGVLGLSLALALMGHRASGRLLLDWQLRTQGERPARVRSVRQGV
jgi:hypothetical protein